MEIKGFVFSIDALIAVILIVAASSILFVAAPYLNEKEKAFDQMRWLANDDAANAIMIDGEENLGSAENDFQYCQQKWDYASTENPAADGQIETINYCRGRA